MPRRPRDPDPTPPDGDPPRRPLPEGLQPRANVDGRVLYSSTFPGEALRLCAEGAGISDLARHFQVGTNDIRLWMVTHPEFRAAVRVGGDVADDRVTMALYERATGFSYIEHSVRVEGEGDAARVYRSETTKHMPPDPAAAMYWLQNRRPHLWRQKVEVDAQVATHTTTRVPPVAADADEWSRIHAPPGVRVN